MKVVTPAGATVELGTTGANPTVGIVDRSRRETDDFGVTTVVERGFSRLMSVQVGVPYASVDAVRDTMAALRSTSALWIADERYAALKVQGFYKEFEAELNLSLSLYSLSIEGLTETTTAVDAGADPATDGRASTLRLLQPVPIAGAMLVSSTVPENDAPEWNAGTTYGLGARVIKAATHRIYESVTSGNVGSDPAGAGGTWADVGPTNRWAMFDQALGTALTVQHVFAVTLDPGAVDAVALLDTNADGARVRLLSGSTVLFDQAKDSTGAGRPFIFTGLPRVAGARVEITVARTSSAQFVSVGTVLVGRMLGLGRTEISPSAGITDYSRKEVDDFGGVTVVQRAWAKRMSTRALIRSDAVDAVFNRIAAVRAVPSLWIAEGDLDSLTVYGFFRNFSIEIGENVSRLSLSIEGLSTAAKAEPLAISGDWADLTDRTGTKPKNNADKTSQNTSADTLKLGGKGWEAWQAEVAAAQEAAQEAQEVAGEATGAIEQVRTDLQQELVAGTAIFEGRVDAIRARIRQGSPNLLPGGDFYDGLNGWTVSGAGWSKGSNQKGAFAFNNGGAINALIYRDFPAQPGIAYSVGADMDLNAPATAIVAAQWVRANGSVITSWANLSSDEWVRVASAPVTAPADAVAIRVLVIRTGAGGSFGATRIQVQEGVATDFDPSPSLGEAAANIAVNRTAISGVTGSLAEYDVRITAAKNSADNANTALAGYDGRITAAANNAAAAVQKTDTITASLGTGNPNSVVNGDASNGLEGWTRSASVNFATNPMVGSYFDIAGPGVFYQDQAALPGFVWAVSGEGNVISGSAPLQVQYLNASGQVLDNFATNFAGWDARASASKLAPAGTTTARVLVGLNAGDRVHVSRIAFQRGNATIWRDPATQRQFQATVKQVASALTDETGARASLDTRLTAAVGDQAITLSQLAAAIADADGRLQGFWGISFNGGVPVLSAYYRDQNGVTQQGVVIGGNLTVLGESLFLGSVRTGALANNSVTTIASVSLANPVDGGGQMATVLSYSLMMDFPGTIIVFARGSNVYSSTPISGYGARILIDGGQVDYDGAGAGYAQTGFAMIARQDVGAGVHTVEEQWFGGSSGVRLTGGTLVVMGVKK